MTDPLIAEHKRAIADMELGGLVFSVLEETDNVGWTRVAMNRITEQEDIPMSGLTVHAMIDRRLGSEMTYGVDRNTERYMRTIRRAGERARASFPLAHLPSLPYMQSTLSGRKQDPISYAVRGRALARLAQKAESHGYFLNGSLVSFSWKRDVWNSRNPKAHARTRGTQAFAHMALHDKEHRFEARIVSAAKSLDTLMLNSVFDEAMKEIERQESLPYRDVAPGRYPVLFEGQCMPHFLEILVQTFLNGGNVHGGGHITSNAIGMRLFSPGVTITDEPFHPMHSYVMPVDEFGHVKPMTYPLVENGVLRNLWYDFYGNIKRGEIPAGMPHEPVFGPTSLHLAPGDGPSGNVSALRKLKNGIYVTNLEYTREDNSPDRAFASFSRFGTYVVEGGKIVARTSNLRLFETVQHLFSNVAWLSKKEIDVPASEICGLEPIPTTIAPYFVQINDVNIIGGTPMEMQR